MPSSPDDEEDEVDTIVQPDVIVVSDFDKLIDKGVREYKAGEAVDSSVLQGFAWKAGVW